MGSQDATRAACLSSPKTTADVQAKGLTHFSPARKGWVKDTHTKQRAKGPAHPHPRYDDAMPQSLSQVLLHLVWSTKDRQPLIPAETRPHLHAYLATVTRDTGSGCPRVGGTEDHVHLAVILSRTQAIAALVNQLKSHSSRWMKEQTDSQTFAWQHGYGVFSVGPTDRPALERYIDDQQIHHQKQTFQEEYRAFLVRYGIPFDEKYVWD